MKRMIGRKIMSNATLAELYGNYKVTPVNFDLLDSNAVPFRFKWVVDNIQMMRNASIVTYNTLDIGAHDGTLGALIARMKIDPDQPNSNSPGVDVIESYPPAYEACEALSKVVRDRGFKMRVHNTSLEDFANDRMYDVITAFEVLEHTKDPFYCIEKIYDMLEVGGHVFISVPEEHGSFGVNDKNPYHLWTATAQSVVSTLFYDDRKWQIKNIFDHSGILHVMAMKRSYMA